MNQITEQKLTELLRVNTMTADTLDLRTMTQLFLSQMRVSLYGGATSIPMLPSFLSPFGTLSDQEPVAVAELNDQSIQVCLVTFSHGAASLSDANEFPIPGREYPAPFEDLIFAAAELLEPLLDRASHAVLCMPFPIDYDGAGDGAIRRFPGTMTISDFEKKPILAALNQEWEQRGCTPPHTILISDPDAVMLAAGVAAPQQSRYLGLSWGRNIDVGFAAPGSIVLRWPGIDGKLMLFDGGFSSAQCVPFGLVDFIKDRDCYGPGLDLYLKMVSTDYLGDTFRLVMIKAAERKLLSFGCSRDILSLTRLDLDSVLEFLQDPEGGGVIAYYCREPEDREVGLAVAQAVLDRAARLVCANLSAVMQFSGAGRDPEHPVCIGAWGDALQVPYLSRKLEQYLAEFTQETLGLHAVLLTQDAMLPIGAAAAALYNT